LNPDVVLSTRLSIAEMEKKMKASRKKKGG
jgi:hypothetical protein